MGVAGDLGPHSLTVCIYINEAINLREINEVEQIPFEKSLL